MATLCDRCRVAMPTRNEHGRWAGGAATGIDVLEYADVKIGTATLQQRRWSYIVARRWWLDAGLHVPLRIDGPQEYARLDAMQRKLERNGFVCTPPSCPSPYEREQCPPSR